MTLFISCLLIYHFDMDPLWYVFAAFLYAGHVAMHKPWRKLADYRSD